MVGPWGPITPIISPLCKIPQKPRHTSCRMGTKMPGNDACGCGELYTPMWSWLQARLEPGLHQWPAHWPQKKPLTLSAGTGRRWGEAGSLGANEQNNVLGIYYLYFDVSFHAFLCLFKKLRILFYTLTFHLKCYNEHLFMLYMDLLHSLELRTI